MMTFKDARLSREQNKSLYRAEYYRESRKMKWDGLIEQIPSDKWDLVKCWYEQFSEMPTETQCTMINLVRRIVEED